MTLYWNYKYVLFSPVKLTQQHKTTEKKNSANKMSTYICFRNGANICLKHR